MNLQRFVLPATIAAAFHAVLLYAFTPNDTRIVEIKLSTLFEKPETPPVTVIEQPRDEDDTMAEVKPMPKGEPRPESEEMLRELQDAPFVVTPLIEANRHVIDPGKLVPVGVPNGSPDITEEKIQQQIISSKFLDKEPRATVRTSPAYPASLRHDGIEGDVMVEFDVDTRGRVVTARVRGSTHRAFEEPTLRAVLQWRFEPGLRQGRPVPFRMVIPVNFKLGGD